MTKRFVTFLVDSFDFYRESFQSQVRKTVALCIEKYLPHAGDADFSVGLNILQVRQFLQYLFHDNSSKVNPGNIISLWGKLGEGSNETVEARLKHLANSMVPSTVNIVKFHQNLNNVV